MKQLPKQYDHKEAEKRWQHYWETNKTYHWDESASRAESFVIDTPPPTVSGVLHMGHIFSYTQADFVARWQRMNGKTVFYPMGFDDNGLPTERLVEKVKKVRATDMSREDFIVLCEGVAEEARKEFRRLFESVALSVDWRQEYNTISADSRKISQLSFLDLFHKDYAYRKLQPMLWDPVDQTAIAQAEIEDKEVASHANYILFGLVDESGQEVDKLEIMTTRPELLPACVAVMCHPDDAEKYKGLRAVTPLFGVIVPIVADEKVDKEKGTGAVMCCTFGDETDIHWWREHELDARIVLNKYGKLDEVLLKEALSHTVIPAQAGISGSSTEGDPGLRRDDVISAIKNKKTTNADPKSPGAREMLIGLMQEAGLLVKQEAITHAVKCAERSGAALEFLPTTQWFVKVTDKKEALKAKAAECNWFPAYMRVRIDQWIDGLSWDWCISRQRYFGVPFPVWYSKRAGEEGKIIVASPDQLPVNPLVDLPRGYSRDEVDAEADVMDTWATSSVSPQLSSKAINKEYAVDYVRHQKLFPADLRPQAHEIIRTWAFYTIVKAYLHEGTIPWKNLMISGWCLASDKTKMSKSKGNVVTPVELIEEKGSDAVRYWASTSKLGADTAFSEDVLKIGRKLTTKIWNATQFASLQLAKLEGKPSTAAEDVKKGIITEALDLWILTRLQRAVAKATEEFARFEYCAARMACEDFFWNDFCDNYLELVKARAYGEDASVTPAQTQSAIYTLYHCLNGILRLFAPIVPHITDELYSYIFEEDFARLGSIHARGNWPKASDYPVDETAENAGIAIVQVLNAIRKAKSEKGVSIKFPLKEVKVSKGSTGKSDWSQIAPCLLDLKSAGNAENIVWADSLPEPVIASDDGSLVIASTFGEQQ